MITTKEVSVLFDSSVRKLKKIYGTEALNVQVTTKKIEGMTGMACCLWKVDYQNCTFSSKLCINSELYAVYCKDLDKATIQSSVANTACHEMAHHLDAHRAILQIRNEYVHDLQEFRHTALCNFVYESTNPKNWHCDSWLAIMEEMGADSTSAEIGWHPISRIPSILHGRI